MAGDRSWRPFQAQSRCRGRDRAYQPLPGACLEADNVKRTSSSRARLARIDELLAAHACPFSLEEFKRFSRDRQAGPDNSLFRTGAKTRTIAVFLARIPKNGAPPFVSIELFTPGQEGVAVSGVLPDLLREP